MLTYVYALVRAEKRPPLRALPAAMPGGGPVRLVPAEDVWLAVSTVPAREYDQGALEAGLQDLDWLGPRAVAHEAVVEHFLSCPAVLPMQLFTLFKTDERAVDHVVRTHGKIARILQRIEGHVEWGLRLAWDEQAARALAPPLAASGTAYLARQRDQLAARRTGWAEARGAADKLYRTLGRAAAAARRHGATEEASPQSRLLLDAAFLVRGDQCAAFQEQVRAYGQELAAQGITVALTGPWPPYNFV